MLLPNDLAFLDIDCVEIVGHAGFESDLTHAVASRHLPDDQRWKQRMHLPRRIVQLQFPQDFQIRDVVFIEDRIWVEYQIAGCVEKVKEEPKGRYVRNHKDTETQRGVNRMAGVIPSSRRVDYARSKFFKRLRA